MTSHSTELSETLCSIESIKSYLAGLVSMASDSRDGEPVRLTYIGGEFAKAVGVPFERHLTALTDLGQIVMPKTRRKLAPFVKAYCEDIFELTEDPPGVYFVSLLGANDDMGHLPAPRAPTALRFQRAVWAAFIRPLDGHRRFLNLDRIGFTNASEMPAEGNWREIEERFILGVAPGLPVDGTELQMHIEDWARHAGIPISRLVIPAKPPSDQRQYPQKSQHLEQLFEIIDALPASLTASWSIPAAVLKHLRGSR